MRTRRVIEALLAAAALTAATTSHAQQAPQPADWGKRDFESSCASCHGMDGKGDGAYALTEGLPMPDLRLLSAHNHGEFPYRQVAEIIDGRNSPVIHGIPGMPIWGEIYRAEAAAQCSRTRCNPGSVARARVRALAEYVRGLNHR